MFTVFMKNNSPTPVTGHRAVVPNKWTCSLCRYPFAHCSLRLVKM